MGIKNNNNRSLNEEHFKKELPLDEQDYLIFEYPDFYSENGDKKVKVKDLGEKFATINSFFFDYLKGYHVPAAFVKTHDKNALKFVRYEKFPFSVKILNTVDKRTSKLFGKKENELLDLPIFEIHFGNGNDTLISESHLVAFDLCSNEDYKVITRICSKVNAVLKSFFERRSLMLAEATCQFGKSDEKIFLVDDFTPRSLKVLPSNKEDKWVDPYKFSTSAEIKNYTDHLLNLMSA